MYFTKQKKHKTFWHLYGKKRWTNWIGLNYKTLFWPKVVHDERRLTLRIIVAHVVLHCDVFRGGLATFVIRDFIRTEYVVSLSRNSNYEIFWWHHNTKLLCNDLTSLSHLSGVITALGDVLVSTVRSTKLSTRPQSRLQSGGNWGDGHRSSLQCRKTSQQELFGFDWISTIYNYTK